MVVPSCWSISKSPAATPSWDDLAKRPLLGRLVLPVLRLVLSVLRLVPGLVPRTLLVIAGGHVAPVIEPPGRRRAPPASASALRRGSPRSGARPRAGDRRLDHPRHRLRRARVGVLGDRLGPRRRELAGGQAAQRGRDLDLVGGACDLAAGRGGEPPGLG